MTVSLLNLSEELVVFLKIYFLYSDMMYSYKAEHANMAMEL